MLSESFKLGLVSIVVRLVICKVRASMRLVDEHAGVVRLTRWIKP